MVRCKTMELIYEARRQRLAQLIDERYGGSQTRFAAAVDLVPPSVNERLYHPRPHTTSIAPRRNIGERLARRIEEKLQLPQYWLDGLDLGRRKKPRATSRATPNKPQSKRPTSDKPPPERRVNGDRRTPNLRAA